MASKTILFITVALLLTSIVMAAPKHRSTTTPSPTLTLTKLKKKKTKTRTIVRRRRTRTRTIVRTNTTNSTNNTNGTNSTANSTNSTNSTNGTSNGTANGTNGTTNGTANGTNTTNNQTTNATTNATGNGTRNTTAPTNSTSNNGTGNGTNVSTPAPTLTPPLPPSPTSGVILSPPISMTVPGTPETFDRNGFKVTVAQAYALNTDDVVIDAVLPASVAVTFRFRAATAAAANAIATNFIQTAATNPTLTASAFKPLVAPTAATVYYTPLISTTFDTTSANFNATLFGERIVSTMSQLAAAAPTVVSNVTNGIVEITSIVEGSLIVVYRFAVSAPSYARSSALAFRTRAATGGVFPYRVEYIDVLDANSAAGGLVQGMGMLAYAAAALLAVLMIA